MAKWQDEYLTMLDECRNRESQLSEWESDFIQSIQEQLDDDRLLSSKQIAKLEDIWERVT